MAIAKQVIGALGDLGQEILTETVKAPAELAGIAIESGKGNTNPKQQVPQEPTQAETTLGKVTGLSSEEQKKIVARNALMELIGQGRPKQPDAWEKKKKEDAQRDNAVKQRQDTIEKQSIREPISVKRHGRKPRQKGGIFEKISEASKNIKAE